MPEPAAKSPERLGAFHLKDYELPLLLRIRQLRNQLQRDSAAPAAMSDSVTNRTSRQFLIEVQPDHVYLIEISDVRIALA